jgi:hypothetical protein
MLVLTYGIDFPFWDEWDPNLAGLYIKFHHHQLTFADLAAQHNEHRILIPRLMLLALNSATHFNAVGEMIFEWVLICFTSAGILRLIQQTHEDASRARVIGLWFLCNLLIFTPAQWENLIWGAGVINVMPMALIVWMLGVLRSGWRPMTRLIVAILLAAAATYSSGNGFLAWPMGLALLAWPRARGNKRHMVAWLASAAVFFGLYFVGYKQPDHNGSHPYATDFLTPLNYFLNFLGAPFAFSSTYPPERTAPVIGTVMLLMLGAIALRVNQLRRENPQDEFARRAVVWLTVAFFAIGSAALAAVTRAGFTAWQAIQSTRYVTFALYLPVALVVLVPITCQDWLRRADAPRWKGWLTYAPAAAASLMILLQIFTFPNVINSCKVEYRTRYQTKAVHLLANVLPDNPMIKRLVYSDPAVARQEGNELGEMGWLRPKLITTNNAALIQETDPKKIARVKGALERGGKRSETELAVMGWAVFVDEGRPADAVFLTYDNPRGEPIIFAMAELGVRRDDVAQELGDYDFTPSGWLAVFPPSQLPADPKQVTIRAWALDTDTATAVLLPGSTTLQK